MLENELKNLWKSSGDSFQVNVERLVNTYVFEKKLNAFDRKFTIRNWRETIVSLGLIIFFGKQLMLPHFPLLVKTGIILTISGLVFVIWKMWDIRARKPKITSDLTLLEELIQLKAYFLLELKMNKKVMLWYMLPLLPGYLFYMIGMIPLRTPLHSIAGFAFGILVSVLVWWLNVKKTPKVYEPLLNDLDAQIKSWEE